MTTAEQELENAIAAEKPKDEEWRATQGMLTKVGDHYVAHLPSGQTFGFRENPDKEPSIPGALVDLAVHRLLKLEAKLRDVTNNAELSVIGREKQLAPVRDAVLRGIARNYEHLEEEAGFVQAREAAFYAVPGIAATDSATSIEDREIRDWERNLTSKQRLQLAQDITNGKHPRITLALARSPIPCGVSEECARNAWRKCAEQARPDELRRLQAQQASVQWARATIGAAAQIAAKTSGYSEQQLFNTLWGAPPKEMSGMKGLAVFGFDTPEKVRMLQGRFKKKAA